MTVANRDNVVFIVALLVGMAAAPGRVMAKEPGFHALELGIWGGYALPVGDAVADKRGGQSLAIQVRYRSPSGLGAYVEGSYAPLFSSKSLVNGDIPGHTVEMSNSLDAWMVIGGLGVDWRFLRLDAGLGLAMISMHSTIDRVTISPLSLNLVYSVAATAFFIDRVVRLGAGVRAYFASSSGLNFLLFTLNLGADVVRRH